MEQENKLVDYYKILKVDKKATEEEIKKSYQRLVLQAHPDKQEMDCSTFHLIHKAWTVLRDPARRKHYDAELYCQEHTDVLLYEKVKLSDMTYLEPHQAYMYYCRCGGTYLLDECDAGKQMMIGCDECSFSIQIPQGDHAVT